MRKRIDKILETTLIVLMLALVFDVLWQVLSRYIITPPSSFTDELAGFILIWIGVLGAAYVTGKGEHLAIDLVLQKASPKRQRQLQWIINTCVALFALLVMVIGGVDLVLSRFQLNVNSSALQIPLGYVYAILPISGVLILYYSIANLFCNAKQGGN